MMSDSITSKVAKFALADNEWEEVDFKLAKVALMDYLSVALPGSRENCVKILDNLAKDQGNAEQATVLGMPQKRSCLWAALINGTSAHIYDFDDVHAYLPIHLSVTACSAALAAAEYVGASGNQMLMAILNGMQVSVGVASAVYLEHYKQGWHGTSTMGAFGAAATAGYLLDLTPEEMCCAFGIVASGFGGVHMNFGTMTKSFHLGFAAHQGLQAALMAKEGFTANTEIFDSKFLHVISTHVDHNAILKRINGENVVRELRYKNYPCVVTTHAAILGCLKLVKEHNLTAADIKEVVQEVNTFSMMTVGTHYPKSGLGGKFSSTYCMAVAIVKGEVTLDSFHDDVLNDPEIQKLLPRTKLIPNDEFNHTRNGRTTITCYDGSVYQTEIRMFGEEYDAEERARQVREKYYYYAGLILSDNAVVRTIEIIENLERIDDICMLSISLAVN